MSVFGFPPDGFSGFEVEAINEQRRVFGAVCIASVLQCNIGKGLDGLDETIWLGFLGFSEG